MRTLPDPVEILDLQDEGVLQTTVDSWEDGEITIKPAQFPQGKVVQVLRLHVPTTSKAHFPYYHDVTSKTLVAQLRPVLQDVVTNRRTIKVTKHGIAPSARFTLEII